MLKYPVKPMLLEAKPQPFDSTEHVYEWKVDGIRCIAHWADGKSLLQSKSGKNFTLAFPELWALPTTAKEAIFDGEVTVFVQGKPDLGAVMERYHASSKRIARYAITKTCCFVVWDILWLNGSTLVSKPLMERKQILADTLQNTDVIRLIDYIEDNGLAMWEAIKYQGLEGMVAKKKNSRYSIGKRSPAWIKVKNFQKATVNILGYHQKDGVVLVGLGNIIQGRALGINPTDRQVLWRLLEEYGKEGKGNVIWLPIGARARVKFTTLTNFRNMRDCTWLGFEV